MKLFPNKDSILKNSDKMFFSISNLIENDTSSLIKLKIFVTVFYYSTYPFSALFYIASLMLFLNVYFFGFNFFAAMITVLVLIWVAQLLKLSLVTFREVLKNQI